MIQASQSSPLLEVDQLTVRLNSSAGCVHAVENVSFALHKGKTLGIVGESGSGKSVMARSLMGLLPARSIAQLAGKVTLHQKTGTTTDLLQMPEKSLRHLRGPAMAMIFQDPMTALNPVLRLSIQLTEPLRQHLQLDRKQARERAIELLAAVGIPDPGNRIDQYPHQLSGGMRQRVVIAIALACSPSLLIADEPTTALDVTVQKQILDLLARLQKEHHMAMILITHDLGVVANRADHIAVMYAGRVVEYASARTLFTNMKHPYTEALFNSIPRINDPIHTRLQAIPGRPPQLVEPGAGCAFAPRCIYARERCHQETPPVISVDSSATGDMSADAGASSEHRHACFYPVGTKVEADSVEGNHV